MKKQYYPPYMKVKYISFEDIVCTSGDPVPSTYAEDPTANAVTSDTIGDSGTGNID